MIKKLLAALLALFAFAVFAAVDVNKATQAELESIKGIGPAISGKILDERNKGAFKDWKDMIDRVKGVGEGNAAKFSTEGLTVNGTAFAGAPAAAKANAAKAAATPATPAATPATPAAPATATAAKADAKPAAMSADDKKAAAKKEKEDKKAAKAAAAEEKKKEKADKAAAKAPAAASAAASTPAKK